MDGVTHKMPQFKGKKGSPNYLPDAPLNYLPAGSLKQPGASKGGSGVRSHKMRQDTGNKKVAVY